ncbi:MAG: hypothetical protein P0111_10410 [Nitrospira sp.]|nr:hypothetical protein [Nitrospira sp.]
MNDQRQRLHYLILVALCFVLGLCARPALATDLPVYGGLGGNDFRAECPKGSYLVGLAGRTGEWVDRIAPVCAPWVAARQAFGAPSVGPSHGASTGGQERHKSCWNEFVGRVYVVQSWKIDVLRSDNHYVQRIKAYCASMLPSVKSMSFYFGDKDPYDENVSFGPFGTRPPEQSCPAGEVAVGIRTRAGQFVDAIGLICGPRPPSFGAAATKPLGPLVQAPSSAVTMNPQAKNTKIAADMFVITKPASGDKIAQGQLVITATPPKVGATNVTELELRFLDAPSAQRDSYPYYTVFSVGTENLVQGYPVAQIVTGAYSGRWQVRARSSMKTPPGPWSYPVQFQLMKASQQQSSPIQTSPLPSSSVMQPSAVPQATPLPPPSVMQAPPPSSSASTQMRRSPFMSRGVEGQEADEPPRPTERKP